MFSLCSLSVYFIHFLFIFCCQVPAEPHVDQIDENIALRTRSKLPLNDTPLEEIEQAFIPPDITPDLYDTTCDNADWQEFLKEFMQPMRSG